MEKEKIDENNVLLNRLILSLFILVFIRMGTFIPVPGIDPSQLDFYMVRHSITQRIFSTFSGNGTVIIGLFTLNIFPYINASIIMQLIVNIFPKLSKLQKEGGSEGIRTINKLTRLITFLWAILQSAGIAFYVKRAIFDWTPFLAFEIIIWLTTGALIVLWLSEIITEYGLGNGPSLLIYINIISSLPNFLKSLINDSATLNSLFINAICLIGSLYGIVLLQEAVRRIPLISSRQLSQASFLSFKNSNIETDYNYIPLRYNQAGVMPIILTTAILIIPTYIYNIGVLSIVTPILTFPAFASSYKIIYWVAYFVLIVIFSLFYSTIVLNPKDISYELQKMAVTIPGLRPGIETTFYLKQVIQRITVLGSLILALLTTVPNLIATVFSISDFTSLGTTSLLILVGVILDLTREIRSIILSNIYNDMFN